MAKLFESTLVVVSLIFIVTLIGQHAVNSWDRSLKSEQMLQPKAKIVKKYGV